jgi:hypothetical protein
MASPFHNLRMPCGGLRIPNQNPRQKKQRVAGRELLAM